MSIASYSQLKSSITNWLHRSGMDAVVPDLITLAEERMNALVTSRYMDAEAILTTEAGVNHVDLPAGLLDIKNVVVAADPLITLRYITADQLSVAYALSSTQIPRQYTVLGDRMLFGPTPDAAYSVTVRYQTRIPPLSDTNSTNWVLENYPSAYLYGALAEAAPYMRDDPRIAVWEKKFGDAVSGINAIDWFSGSTPRVRAG